MKTEYISEGHRDTFELGKKTGLSAKAGEVYALSGDLGAGKTVFTQGFAEGFGIKDIVVSPTFTILQIYEDGRLPLYHFDVYRIGDDSEMEEIGFYEYICGDGVCLIEWADIIEDILPVGCIRVEIKKDIEKGADIRRISIEG